MTYSAQQIRQWDREDRERDRAMTPQQRLDATMALFYMGCDMMRLGIRLERPDAGPDEVNQILHQRIQDRKRAGNL